MPATGVVDHARSPSRQRKATETAEAFPKKDPISRIEAGTGRVAKGGPFATRF